MSDDSNTNPYARPVPPHRDSPTMPAQPYAPPLYAPSQPQAPGQPHAPGQPYSSGQPHAPAQPYAPALPYASGQPYAAPLPTSGLAVASLITGIAGIVLSFAVFPLLASLAAIITGHMALKQTHQGSGVGGRGMAIAGLILGYVGVAILALIVIISIFSFLFISSVGFFPLLLS